MSLYVVSFRVLSCCNALAQRMLAMLRFAEEIILLLLDEERGELATSLPPHSLRIVLAGAVLMDLAFEDRIDTDLKQLTLADATPLEDDLLDPTLAAIAGESHPHDARFWVAHAAKQGDEIRDKVLARLTQRGILEYEPEGLFFFSRLVSRSRRYPMVDGKSAEEVQLRIMRVLFSNDIPDPRDIVIICLVDACGLFDTILSKSERAEVQERIELVRKMDLIGQAVTEAIQELEPPSAPAARRPEEIPNAPGVPLIGNAIDMLGDIGAFIATQYYNLGPIFRVRALNRRFIVLVGPEANSFVARGNKHFSNYEPWQHFQADIGATRMLISMEGTDHIRMRRAHAHYYSRNLLENRMADAIDILRRETAEWSQHKAIRGQYAFQRIVTEQMGVLIANTSPKEYLDDLIIFFEKLMSQSISPHVYKLATYQPHVQRARKRVLELAQKILAEHDPKNRRRGEPDFIDELLELNRTDPQYLPETNLPMTALGPVLVGLDTVSSICAFMLYEVLKRPDLLEQMTAEADALFDPGLPTVRDLRQLDVTRRIAMETLRLYPLGSVIPRRVANSFEFEGYTIPAGEDVLLGIPVLHHHPDYFPNPLHFDIERYTKERAEHRQPGAYAPFGVGAHKCLGSSLAEVLIALNMALVVRETELALEPPNYQLKIKRRPVAQPGPSFKFRLVRRRK